MHSVYYNNAFDDKRLFTKMFTRYFAFRIWYIPVKVVICFICCLVTSATVNKEVFQKHLSIVLRKKSLNFDKYSSRFVPY